MKSIAEEVESSFQIRNIFSKKNIQIKFGLSFGSYWQFCSELPLVIICLISLQTAFSQITVSGKVVNENGRPVPYAHLRIEGGNLGTISNDNGEFKLTCPKGMTGKKAIISSVGYLTQKIHLKQGYHVLTLKQDVTTLAGVTVMPRNYAKELVKSAIKAIPDNYPNEEERHTGFFRETTSWERNENSIYVAEAVIEAIKKPYLKSSRSGHIKLIEFRKYESGQLDSLNARIYAGGHHIHRFDIVARRGAFLSNPKAYSYKIIDTLNQQGKTLYKIYFEKKKQLSGHVFVMDSTFAITKVDLKDRSFFNLPGKERHFLEYSVSYEQGDDKLWRFKHSHYETGFKRREKLLNLVSDYVSTDVRVNEVDIPYLGRLQYGDIILDEPQEYRPSFWKDYNVILPNDSFEELFKSADSQEKKKDGRNDGFINILKRFSGDIAFTFDPIKGNAYVMDYANAAIEIGGTANLGQKRIGMSLSSSLLYEVDSGLFVGYCSESKISKTGISSHDLVISKAINLNRDGRPISISPEIRLGHQQIDWLLESITTPSNFSIDGKSFDGGKTDVFLSQKNIRALLGVKFSLEHSHRLRFFVSTGYNFPLREKVGLLFKEKEGFFLGRKKEFLENNKGGLIITHDGPNALENDIFVNIGLTLNF